MRIFRKKRSMQVGTIYGAVPGSLKSILTVIAVAYNHFAQRLYSGSEKCFPAVIFKTNQRKTSVIFDDDITNHAPISGNSVGIDQRNPAQLRSFVRAVIMSEQLIASANREDNRSAFDGRFHHILAPME